MKSTRYIKLRTYAKGPLDIMLEKNNNPMKRKIPLNTPGANFTDKFLDAFKQPEKVQTFFREP